MEAIFTFHVFKSCPEIADIAQRISAWGLKTNMAAKHKRSDRVDYLQLHNLSSTVLFEFKAKKIKTFPKTFEVERIITKRKAAKVSRSKFVRIYRSTL